MCLSFKGIQLGAEFATLEFMCSFAKMTKLLLNLINHNTFNCVQGTLGYVPQQSWIESKSIRDNILLGDYFRESEYWSLIEACALMPDLEVLPAGDQTFVGAKVSQIISSNFYA